MARINFIIIIIRNNIVVKKQNREQYGGNERIECVLYLRLKM